MVSIAHFLFLDVSFFLSANWENNGKAYSNQKVCTHVDAVVNQLSGNRSNATAKSTLSHYLSQSCSFIHPNLEGEEVLQGENTGEFWNPIMKKERMWNLDSGVVQCASITELLVKYLVNN